MKKIISAILITTMVLSILSLPAASQSTIQTSGATYDAVKDETVYAVLNFDGSISAVNIVNRINTPTDGTYSDYGLYSAITNLSNTASPRIEGEKINWPLSANEKGFYYSGIVENAQPPFLFGLIYSLDGKTCKAEDLIGKTGRIEMYISINSNINSNKYFTDNFVCQIQIPLSLDLCGNISSEGASAVTVGKTKTLAYTILPGKSKNITIGFDAKNFEMDGITATMSFLNEKNLIDIDTDEIKSGITEMTEGIDELLLGTNKLKDGTVLMADAISDTAVGSQELQNGIGELNNGIDKYTSAVSEINDNTKDVSNALSLLSQNGAELGAGYGQLSTGTTQFLESMKALIATLPPDQQGAYLQQIAQLEGQLEGYGENLDGYISGVSQSSEALEAISGGIDSLAGENSSLVSGASELQNGLSQFNSGIYSIYEGSKTLPSQIQELINGEQEFKNGISGTSKQFEGINITDNSNVKAVSFASGSHNVNSVSFVVKIPELKIKKDEPPQIATQNNKSFWDRFLDLFR